MDNTRCKCSQSGLFNLCFLCVTGRLWTATRGRDGCPTTHTGSCARTLASSNWKTLSCGRSRCLHCTRSLCRTGLPSRFGILSPEMDWRSEKQKTLRITSPGSASMATEREPLSRQQWESESCPHEASCAYVLALRSRFSTTKFYAFSEIPSTSWFRWIEFALGYILHV